MESKGMSLLSIQKFVSNFGEEVYARWLNSLPDKARELYSWQILASSWYNTEILYTPAIESVSKIIFGGDDVKTGKILGASSAKFALTGAYRILLDKKDPVAFFKNATMLMKQLHRPSRLDTNTNANKSETLLEMYEYPRPYRVYEESALNYILEALKMIGFPDVKWEIRSRKSQGAVCSVFHFAW